MEHYVDDILKTVAIPKLMDALESTNPDERLKVAENLAKISEDSPDQLKIVIPHIKNAINDSNKSVAKLMAKSLKN